MGYYNNSAQTFLLVTIIIASFAVISSSGGLLSNHLLVKKSHYYLVQRITDIADKDINTSSVSSEDEQAYDKGTLTSAVSSSTAINTRTSYSDCGSVASIKSLTLNPCDKSKGKNGLSSDICEIKRGSNATFNLSFVPKSNATQLRSVIHGIVDFVPIPFPCPQPDACHNSGITCPIQAGQQYDYVLSAPVKDSYPRMKLWIKGQLQDEEGEDVVCVKIHVHIV